MRSIAFAVVIFAGILACSSAAPQLNRFDLGWLEAILKEAGQRNSTVRFGNNTVIISGVSNAVASTNDGTIRPTPPDHQHQWNNQQWNPWYNNRYPYFNGGYWRISPNVNGQSVEQPLSSSEESREVADDISDEPSEEDVYSQENQTVEDEEYEEEDNAEHDGSEDTEDATVEEVEEVEDEEIDPEEEAVDAELEVIEKELAAKETN